MTVMTKSSEPQWKHLPDGVEAHHAPSSRKKILVALAVLIFLIILMAAIGAFVYCLTRLVKSTQENRQYYQHSEQRHHSSENYRYPCGEPRNTGECSESEKVLSWYFDTRHEECLASKACPESQEDGAEVNRFFDMSDCSTHCKYMDGPTCAPGASPTTRTGICNSNQDCPSGYRCKRGAFVGSCCNDAIEDLYLRNYRPQCSDETQKVLKHSSGGLNLNLLGRQCADNFCPADTQCEQGELFAYCCS